MTTCCPKCQFEGRNIEQCERCGIIFERMHTIMDMRPLGALAGLVPPRTPAPGPPPPSADQGSPTVNVRPYVGGAVAPASIFTPDAIAQAFPRPGQQRGVGARAIDRDATAREIPLVSRCPPGAASTPTWFRFAVAVLVIGAGILVFQRGRDTDAAGASSALAQARLAEASVADAVYFDLAVENLLAEIRTEFRRITDAGHATEAHGRLTGRVVHLQSLLAAALLEKDQQEAYAAALAALSDFLATTVPPAIAKARAQGPRTDPVATAHLTRAAIALERARRP